MTHFSVRDAQRPRPDAVLSDMASYALSGGPFSNEARETARLCLMDSLGCALAALEFPACTRLLGPVVPGAVMPGGARVPGTEWELDPVQAAFNIGAMIRWLDFNDTFLAAEWGHPSDNLGAILAVADYLDRRAGEGGGVTMGDVLTSMIQAHEIQGVMALENSFNRVGLDHVLLVRVASTAVAAALLGGSQEQVVNALSNAWIDGGALRAYRHAPNTGSRKSWAAGDAASRAVRLALMALQGEMGYPSALSAKGWGWYDVLFKGRPFSFSQPYGGYVMENVLFKISFPAEFHAQTAVEAALALHGAVKDRLDAVERVVIETQEAGSRIIDKTGPLDNPADRDHCLQYMVAVPLIHGALTARHYEDEAAQDPRIDALRDKMEVRENPQFTVDYMDPDKRAIGNAVQVHFRDGSATARVEVAYPIGHRRRRGEAVPLLEAKFQRHLDARLPAGECAAILTACASRDLLEPMRVRDFMDLWVVRE